MFYNFKVFLYSKNFIIFNTQIRLK